MSSATTLRWMAEVQARFSAALRTPLDASAGVLRANPARYPSGAARDIAPSSQLSAAQRLAVYQGQYWSRLLRVLQAQYPLTMHLLGAWRFNLQAMRFLCEVAPRHHDLGEVACGFDEFLARQLGVEPLQLPHAALIEAARIDAGYRHAFLAPAARAYDPARGLARRLRLAPDVARVQERWPLLALRGVVMSGSRPAQVERAGGSAAADGGELPGHRQEDDPRRPAGGDGHRASDDPAARYARLPPALPAPRHWLLRRRQRRVLQLALDPVHARLFRLLDLHDVESALAELERSCPASERESLPARVHELFALAGRHSLFVEG
jgi:hypothetical protein